MILIIRRSKNLRVFATRLFSMLLLAACIGAVVTSCAQARVEATVRTNSIIKATASSVYQNETTQYGPQLAFDGEPETRWATDDTTSQAWIAIDLGAVKAIHGVRINEAYAGRVQNYELQYREGTTWKTFLSGATLDANFEITFPTVKAQEFRLNILSAKQGPTISEIEWF